MADPLPEAGDVEPAPETKPAKAEAKATPLYGTITGDDPVHAGYVPYELGADQAALVKRIASETLNPPAREADPVVAQAEPAVPSAEPLPAGEPLLPDEPALEAGADFCPPAQ